MIPTPQTYSDEHPCADDNASEFARTAQQRGIAQALHSEALPAVPTASPSASSFNSETLDADFLSEDDYERLLRSFDMIFRLHQRSEEIRSQLEKIEAILLTSRTVTGLAERLVQTLQKQLDLVSARILLRETHPMSSAFRLDAPYGAGIVPDDFPESDRQFRSDPFVLDDPMGELARGLFGDSVSLIASAAVAHLGRENEDLGLLCLGSDDPVRYCGNMNTDLISEVANKISLGFYNAWDHETSIRRAIDGSDPEIYSEQFFQAYLRKEFARAWRNHDCFSLMAISWEASDHDSASCEKQFVKLLQNSLRSSDLVARGELAKFWVLLPDTAADEAQCAAQRLTLASHEHTRGQNPLRIGVTEFSRHTPTQSALLQEALAAMQDASDTAQSIVISKVSSAAGQ